MSLFGLFKRTARIQHPLFGELFYQNGCWRGSTRFRPIDTDVKIKIKQDKTPPTEDVAVVFQKLEAEFDEVVPQLKTGIAQLIPSVANMLNEPADSIMRRIDKDDVLAIVSLRQIQFESVSMKEIVQTVLPSHMEDDTIGDDNSVITQFWFTIEEAPGFLIRSIVSETDEGDWNVGSLAVPGKIE